MEEHTLQYLLPTISKSYSRSVTLITDYNAQKEKKLNSHTLNSLNKEEKN